MLFATIIFVWILSIVVAPFLLIARNVSKAKPRLSRWSSNETLTFGMSLGGFGASKREFWRRRGNYNDDEARIIAKYQNVCLLEIVIALVIICLAFDALLHAIFRE
jgi:hypothetical protein